MKVIPQKISTILTALLISLLILTGCDTQNSAPKYASTTSTMIIFPQEPNTVWDRMGAEFTFKSHQTNPRVEKFIKQYSREDYYRLIKLSEQSSPYLYHVVKTLEERGLPPELALLPIIESEYRANATSNRGAVGFWQLASMTGRLYGLKQDQWYDGRKDIEAATNAALDHLEFLYNKFDHDWLLALAAYNAGGARVATAMRNNKKVGKPTDYWSLSLPQETQHFVPKFLALVHLVKNYRNLDINLAAIPNSPYFGKVKLAKQIHLDQAAKFAEIDIKEVKKLNAAYRSQVTHPKGPHEILLPVQNMARFKANLDAAAAKKSAVVVVKPKAKASKQVKAAPSVEAAGGLFHTVNKGDTLNLIATKYGTTVADIKNKNKLNSDIIRSGQKLAI